MKNKLIIGLLMAFFPIMLSAQGAGGQVRRTVKKQYIAVEKPSKKKQKAPKKQGQEKPAKQEPVSTPVEAAGYDVTISCNVPSATLYIDGTSYGIVDGKRFIKTGLHTIKLVQEGYEDLEQIISVSQSSRVFSFQMVEKKGITGCNVTISCNEPTANLYIDGIYYGNATGIRFLQIGKHNVKVTSEGCEDYIKDITVNADLKELFIELVKTHANNKAQSVNLEEMLGGGFAETTETQRKQLGIDGGIQILKVYKGRLKYAGVPRGFIVLTVNNLAIMTINDLQDVVKGASASKEPILYIQGVYPTGKKGYFAVNL